MCKLAVKLNVHERARQAVLCLGACVYDCFLESKGCWSRRLAHFTLVDAAGKSPTDKTFGSVK